MSLDVCVNRTMRKATFETKGMAYVGELVLSNLQGLKQILEWNLENDILLYRMSSDMFPWVTEYELHELPNYSEVKAVCEDIGSFAKQHGMRLSFHPGPFNVLGSNNSNTVNKTVNELTKHGDVMDLMGLDRSHQCPINIHVSATKPDKQVICDNFCRNFELLPETVSSRLTVENDDKLSQYSPQDLYDLVHSRIGIPITFDQFHFECARDPNIEYSPDVLQEALELCLSTWDVKPLTHHSSTRVREDDKARYTAHADYIYEPIQSFGHDFDTDIEAKAKDLAVLRYKEQFEG
jgi:UV DNA damage endonuclease